MRVLVDDAPVEVFTRTLASALERARAVAQSRGRVVVEVTINGLTIPDAMLADPSDADLGESEVRFTTVEPAGLVQATFRDVRGLLAQAKRDQTEAGQMVQTGELRQAMEKLGGALRVWDTVQQAVSNGAALMNVDVESLRVTDGAGVETRVSDAVSGLAARLTEVKRSITAQDWAGLGDALLFDMNEQADRWQVLLERLGDGLTRR